MNTAEPIVKKVDNRGKYLAYEGGDFMKNDSTVLFFHANWCPSCRAADKNISAETIPAGLNVIKVDYDEYKDLRKKYGITSQHTFVQIDADGNMIKKWVGGSDIDDIAQQL